MKGEVPGGRTLNPIKGVKISYTAAAYPEAIKFPDGKSRDSISNEEIFYMLLGENYEKILESQGMNVQYPEKVVGIKHRSWTHIPGTPANHNEENTVDLGIKAGKKLLEKANLKNDDIDMIIVSSTTPFRITSATSCAVAAGLDIKAPCLDLKAGCSSGLFGLVNAAMHVSFGIGKVLLIATETPSKYANPKIHETVLGIGDGATAYLLESGNEDQGILGGFLGSDGELGKLVNTPGLIPPTKEAIDKGLYYYHGDTNNLKEAVPPRYIDAMKHTFKVAQLSPEQIDLYVPHQVNRSLTQKVGEILGFPIKKQHHNLHKHGSMAGSALLNNLHDAIEEKKVKKGSKIALNVVGGGLSWGGLIWQF